MAQPIINQYLLAMCEIDGYPIDAVVTESHDYENEVTSFPVESGVDISDHVRRKPVKVTMEGLVSDSPIGAVARHTTRQTGLPSDTSKAKLEKIRDSGDTVTIITSLGVFKNMLMSSLSFPRDGDSGHQNKFKAEFIQLQIVTNNRILVRTATPGGQGNQPLGAKLAKLGVTGVQVFTLKAADKRKPVYPLILISKNGDKHYLVSFGSPKADGYVSNSTYFPYQGFFGAHLDPATGQWLDAQGRPLSKTKPKAVDNNGWHSMTTGLSNF